MRLQQPVQAIGKKPEANTSLTTATGRHNTALLRLVDAFEKEQPVALMIGDCPQEFSHVIGAFLNGLEDTVTYVRLMQPQADALMAMREINRALGFDPKDLSLSDLQSVLTMFLDFQSKHHRRTVICVEKADEQAMWLVDCVARLLGPQHFPRRHLMIVMSGKDDLSELLQKAAFENIRKLASAPIQLAPFTLDETQEFVRQWSQASGHGDMQRHFEYEAIERLHILSAGIPPTIARLCQECDAIIGQGDSGPITGKAVVKAARSLRLESGLHLAVKVVGNSPEPVGLELTQNWLIRRNGKLMKQLPFEYGRFIVGRSEKADIQLPYSSVSRRHALIISTADSLQVLDLGSTNGTFVDGFRIQTEQLGPGSVLKMGDCELVYDIN